MPLAECTPEIIQIIVFTGRTDHFFIPQPVFISGDQAAAKSEIPGQEGIEIENIDIAVNGSSAFVHGISILINISIAVELHAAQVVTTTESEVNPGREIINPAENGSNISKIDKCYNRFVIDFSSFLANIICLPFIPMKEFQS